jgi:beta-1,4-mannooligosaccharide/beta-1,4-mannosyl-N-acetylglucosamine phosphorylase
MTRIAGQSLPNIPWQERPEGSSAVIWRYDANPVIPRDILPDSNSVFNSAVVPFRGGFAGVFRCDDTCRSMDIHAGFSADGIRWRIEGPAIRFEGDPEVTRREYRYDPRVCLLEGRYFVTWCNGYHGPTVGVGYTEDFSTFHQLENAFLPCNRNGVLFPRKINGRYAMLSRPSDNGHTPFGDIFLSESPDLMYWGRHRHVMGPVRGDASAWQSTKVGAGPAPIETDEGWLLIYHGVLTSCNGYVYSFGAALLDLDAPWRVIARSRAYLLSPQAPYECVGDVPNVVFPCAALSDAGAGRIAIYYGCADTATGLAFTTADGLVDFIRRNRIKE